MASSFECTLELFDAEKDRFPYADGYFSTVLCCELVEHLTEDPMHMMAEINRILRPGGHLVLTTPNIGSLRAIAGDSGGLSSRIFSRVHSTRACRARSPRRGTIASTRLARSCILFYYAGFDMTLLETGPFRDEPQPEHEWVKHLIERYEHACGLARRWNLRRRPQEQGRCANVIRPGCINELAATYVRRARGTELEVSLVHRKSDRARHGPLKTFRSAGNSSIRNRNVFIEEGAWTPVASDVPPGAAAKFEICDPISAGSRRYEIYVSPHSDVRRLGLCAGRAVPARSGGNRRRWRAPESWRRRSPPCARCAGGECRAALPRLFASSGANHRSESSPDPLHGASRYSGALSRIVRGRLLDRPESAAADVDVFLRLRYRAAERFRATKAAPVSRSIFWPGCCPGSRFPNPWAAPRS